MKQKLYATYWFGIVVLFVAGASLTACGDDGGSNSGESGSDLDWLEVESEAPKFKPNPGRLDFPVTIAPGESEEMTFVFGNAGEEELQISNLGFHALASDAFKQGSKWPTGPIVLQSLETVEVSVIYEPADGNRHTGTLKMETNDPQWAEPGLFLTSEEYEE